MTPISPYPSEEALKRIESWSREDGWAALLAFVRDQSWEEYGTWRQRGYPRYCLATGGWSGNEDLINALHDNLMFWSDCWQVTERGGRYVFVVPKE